MSGTGASPWVNSITAVSTTVAATLLLGFLGTFKDLSSQAPLISEHMQRTTQKLSEIESKQADHSQLLAVLVKDYTSRDGLHAEIGRLESQIRELQVRQAVVRQMLGITEK